MFIFVSILKVLKLDSTKTDFCYNILGDSGKRHYTALALGATRGTTKMTKTPSLFRAVGSSSRVTTEVSQRKTQLSSIWLSLFVAVAGVTAIFDFLYRRYYDIITMTRDELNELLIKVAKMSAEIAVASYKENLGKNNNPVFQDSSTPNSNPVLASAGREKDLMSGNKPSNDAASVGGPSQTNYEIPDSLDNLPNIKPQILNSLLGDHGLIFQPVVPQLLIILFVCIFGSYLIYRNHFKLFGQSVVYVKNSNTFLYSILFVVLVLVFLGDASACADNTFLNQSNNDLLVKNNFSEQCTNPSLYYLLTIPNNALVSLLLTFATSVLFVILLPNKNLNKVRLSGLIATIIPIIWSLYLVYLYDSSGNNLQCVSNLFGLHLSFGIDAVGLSLVVLTAALFPLCVILMRTYKGIITFLLLELVILGALLVLDLLGFYILFEASLILLFLLIARPNLLAGSLWNNQYSQRHTYGTMDAAYKIVLYTMGGSLAFLPVIFIIYSLYGSTNLLVLTTSTDSILSVNKQLVLGWGLLAVFAVKIPLMPVHLWLPEAHVASPTSGSILLAGVLLKLGGIGIIRYLIPLFPSFTVSAFPIIAVMCLASFLFTTLTTLKQVDLKKVVAYSSIGHMALVTLAIFSMAEHSIYSSTFYFLAHGVVSPGLFYLVGQLYERTHTKLIAYYKGLGSSMPVFAVILFLFMLGNCGFPLTPGFVAEILCLVSIFATNSLYTYFFCIGSVVLVVTSFLAFNRVIFGYNSSTVAICDLSRKDLLLILPLFIGFIILGIFPSGFTNVEALSTDPIMLGNSITGFKPMA